MKIKSIVLVGLGALGIMYGKILTDGLGKENVTICADEERIARYRHDGIYANDELCDFQYHSYSEITKPADLVIFSTKYGAFKEAATAAAPFIGPDTIMVSVLNGIMSEQDLEELYGPGHVLYCTVQGMNSKRNGNHVTYYRSGSISLGEKDGSKSEQLLAVKDVLESAGIKCELPDDIMHQLWSKLMLNSGINPITAINDASFIQVLETPDLLAELIGAMKEVQAVARFEGIELTDKEIDDWIKLLGTMNPEATASMCFDVRSKRKTEIDIFSGTISRLGQKYGVPTPISDKLYEQIKAIEENYR